MGATALALAKTRQGLGRQRAQLQEVKTFEWERTAASRGSLGKPKVMVCLGDLTGIGDLTRIGSVSNRCAFLKLSSLPLGKDT